MGIASKILTLVCYNIAMRKACLDPSVAQVFILHYPVYTVQL